MARSKKPYPGMGAYVLILNYGDDDAPIIAPLPLRGDVTCAWVAHMGAATVEKLRAERGRLRQWPDRKVRIVENVPGAPEVR